MICYFRARIVIFGGMAHPAVSWHKFIQPFLSLGINVHVVRLPGRFERFMDVPMVDSEENVRGVCQALKDLDWLASLPLVFMGYSFGSAMAYACARFLEHEWQAPVAHLVCLAGADRPIYSNWKFLSPDDRSLDSFIKYHVDNMGRFNPLFDLDTAYLPPLLELIFEIFHRDMQLAHSWVSNFDRLNAEEKKLSANILCVNGDVDRAVSSGGWLDVAKGRYEQIVFSGDHFFVYQDEAIDRDVVEQITRCILRALPTKT